MNTFFVVLIAIAMVATLGALLFGVATMARGGEGAAQRSNKFMRYRVLLQAVAIGLFALLMLLTR
ncbi:MAG: twin transmembrane helix small protein [Alphaproteobacteria bacterium]|nr:twin transmembrane helix small protein [Alphaproteobacteria bacterium]